MQMVDVICPPLSISSIVVSLWLDGCFAKSTLIGWREYYGGGGVGVDRHLCGAQQTRAFDPVLFQYWPTANGAGPTLKQHWVESSCLLGELSAFWYSVPSVSGRNRQHSALCNSAHDKWFIEIRKTLIATVWCLSVHNLQSTQLQSQILIIRFYGHVMTQKNIHNSNFESSSYDQYKRPTKWRNFSSDFSISSSLS